MKINTIIFGLFLISILILNGCTNKQPSIDIVDVNYEKIYNVPESRQVPFEITLINNGKDEAILDDIYISGFWGSTNAQDQACDKKIDNLLKPMEQNTYTIICYVHDVDEGKLESSSTFVKDFDVTVNYRNKNNNPYQKITQKIISLTKK